MEALKHIKRLIPWEWKYYTKRWIGSFFFDKKEFERNKKILLENIKNNKETPISIDPTKLPKRKLKIIFSIHQFFPTHYAGTERYLLNIATEMKKMGHEILIITYIPNPSDEIKNNQEFYSNKYTYEGLDVIEIYSPKQKTNDSLMENNTEISNFYSTLFDTMSPDVFHVIHPMFGSGAIYIAKQKGIRTIVTLTDYWLLCKNVFLIRNNHLPCFGPKKGKACKENCYKKCSESSFYQRNRKAKDLFNDSDHIIFTSNLVKQVFKFNDFITSNCTIIPHGFFSNDFKLAKHNEITKEIVFAYTGSLVPYKGVHQLIRVFKKITNPSVILNIYGDPEHDIEYSQYLLKLARDDKRIKFLGKYSSEQVGKIHSNINYVVIPSVCFETFSLSALTSLSLNIPVICSNLSGICDFITDDQNGYIYDFDNETSLFNKLNMAIKKRLHNVSSEVISLKEEVAYTISTYTM